MEVVFPFAGFRLPRVVVVVGDYLSGSIVLAVLGEDGLAGFDLPRIVVVVGDQLSDCLVLAVLGGDGLSLSLSPVRSLEMVRLFVHDCPHDPVWYVCLLFHLLPQNAPAVADRDSCLYC